MLRSELPARRAAAFLLVLTVLLPCGAWGASPKKPVSLEDFVHANELTGQEFDGALCRVSIPQEVYRGLIQSQNCDLAVFDSTGEVVPFVVVSEAADSGAPPTRVEAPVPFFELPREDGGGAEEALPADISVRVDADGRIVELRERRPHGVGAVRSYLLDLAAIAPGGAPNSYRLNLQTSGEAELNAKADVLQSENLRDWNALCSDMPLLRLRRGDARFDRSEIELPWPPGRYLLLRVRGVDPTFALAEVRCSCLLQRRASEDGSAEFDGVATPDRRAVEYDLGGAFPVTQLDFVLQEPGLYGARCSSRPDPGTPWRAAGSAVLFRVREAGTLRTNAAMSVGRREDRYWRLDFDRDFSAVPPRLRVGWYSGILYFLAQGRAPWILAYGSARKDLELQSPYLLQDVRPGAAVEAKVGAPVDPNPAGEGPRAERGRPDGGEWQRRLVWGLLLLGAVLLSAIAWKLLRSGPGAGNQD